MKRTKKFLVGLLATLGVLSGSLGLVACDGESDNSSSLNSSSVEQSSDFGASSNDQNSSNEGQTPVFSQGLSYTLLGNGTYEVSGIGTCTDTEIVIPNSYNGKAVTTIGNYAFSHCDGLTSVVIPDSVTTIGSYAFEYCPNLTYNVKNNLKYLGNAQNHYLYLAGVNDTSIASATIENTCKFICNSAFYKCSSLTSVVIGDSVTSIGSSAFYNCSSLTSIVISDSVTSIGSSAFYNCSSLTSVVIPDSVTTIGSYAFEYCPNLTYNVKNNLKYLGNAQNPYLYLAGVIDKTVTGATIENTCRFIGSSAFADCSSLTSVVIGKNVTAIGNYAFSGCSSLTSVTIPDSVTSIGYAAFRNCDSLTSITFNGTVEEWNVIEKGDYWKFNVPATKVICSDGTVTI